MSNVKKIQINGLRLLISCGLKESRSSSLPAHLGAKIGPFQKAFSDRACLAFHQ
jgi:hypothetical protein